ncbi:helix-turn-helix domain-containing protein [Pseudooceanicola onchidii]|uniref:helix-turn-helix domain-containing protein n=1 Tax=Pseudooceanicola onchidii TaxID=2562279 RepID=UPI0010AA1818|nr:XRE family transcriptional regulator [Pseudooceanicola onchidii]
MSKPAAERSRTEMGYRVKTLREKRGLTLQVLSDRSGLAISTISKIERGLMAPTYDRFSGLAKGLGVDVSELFSDRGETFEPGRVEVARVGEVSHLETENYSYELLFTDVRAKGMTPILGTLKPLEKMQFDRMVRHPGEEFLMVLSGSVVVQLEGKDDVILGTGDSLYFDSGRGHLYAAAEDAGARILVVCTHSGDNPVQPG